VVRLLRDVLVAPEARRAAGMAPVGSF
jgi:hypothetical protein